MPWPCTRPAGDHVRLARRQRQQRVGAGGLEHDRAHAAARRPLDVIDVRRNARLGRASGAARFVEPGAAA
jgi:hypothetical protein